MLHSHRGGWRWQETCKALTCLQNWWYCTTTYCLVWSLLRLSCFRLLLNWCHFCTGLLPGTSNWSLPQTACHSSTLMFFCAVGQYLALFCADFHSKCCYSVYKSVGEVLSSPLLLPIRLMLMAKQVAYKPSTDRNGYVVVMECFLHDLL